MWEVLCVGVCLWCNAVRGSGGPTLNYTPGKYPSKSIFNNVIMSHIYSFCRLSDYFWSVHIKFWIIVVGGGSSSEFNISCNVGAGQLSNRVPPYVYHITMQASIRITIRPNSGSAVPHIVRSIWTKQRWTVPRVPSPFPFSHCFCARHFLSKQGCLQPEGASICQFPTQWYDR